MLTAEGIDGLHPAPTAPYRHMDLEMLYAKLVERYARSFGYHCRWNVGDPAQCDRRADPRHAATVTVDVHPV